MMSSTLCTNLLLALLIGYTTNHQSVDVLIKNLGSPRFREREMATRQLLKRLPEATIALKNALKSADPEIVQRAKSILDEYDLARQQRMLSRLRFFAQNGKADLAAELLARWPKHKFDKQSWIEASKLTFRLAQSLNQPARLGGSLLKVKGKIPIFIDAERFNDFRRDRSALLFIRAKEVDIHLTSDAWSGTIMFAAGNLRVRRSRFVTSAAFVCGSARLRSANGVILVADGDVYVDGGLGANNCVIVARGHVHCRDIWNCQIISGKSVVCKRGIRENCTIVENEPNPLGFIQFFDPTKEGITVEQAKNAVRIKQLAAKKPYAKAGLQQADIITSINDAKITSPENFRRVLRKHVAWEEEMTFRVVRDGKELQYKMRPLLLP